jgi:hypothetical protein
MDHKKCIKSFRGCATREPGYRSVTTSEIFSAGMTEGCCTKAGPKVARQLALFYHWRNALALLVFPKFLSEFHRFEKLIFTDKHSHDAFLAVFSIVYVVTGIRPAL